MLPETVPFGHYVVGVMDMLGARDTSPDVWTGIVQMVSRTQFYVGGVPPINSGLPIGMVHPHDKDSIILSFNVDAGYPAGFDGFFFFLHGATAQFLTRGHLLRGAFTAFVGTDMGSAIRLAENLQKHGARYPRIIIQPNADGDVCIPIAGRKREMDSYQGLLERCPIDRQWYFDFLRYSDWDGEAAPLSEIQARLAALKRALQKNFLKVPVIAIDKKSHEIRTKLNWLVQYHDRVAKEIGGMAFDAE